MLNQKETYTVKEIAKMLDISERSAYNFCKETNDFKVLTIGRTIRVKKQSFDEWFS